MPATAAPAPMRGLYAITPDESDDDALLARIDAALRGGLKLLQYRNKTAAPATRQRQAHKLAKHCRARAVQLIINDDVPLARACNAGVHVGASDPSIAAARAALGADALIGASCKNSIAAARAAHRAGASYLAMGAVYPTASKANTVPCPLTTLTAAKRDLPLPIVAIGGITTANAAAVLHAGADAIAVISGLFGDCSSGSGWHSNDITAAAQTFTALFKNSSDNDSRS